MISDYIVAWCGLYKCISPFLRSYTIPFCCIRNQIDMFSLARFMTGAVRHLPPPLELGRALSLSLYTLLCGD